MNVFQFATLKGMDLLKMTEKDFVLCDPNFGSLFYKELLKLMNGRKLYRNSIRIRGFYAKSLIEKHVNSASVSPDDNLIDDVLRKYNKNEEENLASRQLHKQLQQQQ